MVLLAASIQGLENQVNQLRSERDSAQESVDSWRDQFYSERQKAAVRDTQLREQGHRSLIKRLCMTLGAVVLGVAIPIIIGEFSGAALSAILLGLVLLLAGWWPVGWNRRED